MLEAEEFKMTGFWIFMLVTELSVPVIMIVFGILFSKRAPKTINTVFGYRSEMSMKNRETWEFAHRLCGKIWTRSGMLLAPLSLVVMLFCFGKEKAVVGNFGLALMFVQLVVLIGSIFPVESALKKTFDSDGNRRN